MLTRVKGTQDFLDLKLFNFLVDTTKAHLAQYHFTEIMTPILEHTELFKRSLGLETDVVSKEMYILPSSKDSEEESICLRPEATASTMRAFLNNHIQTTPWKVFTWGSMFRHERPQKGRFREFHQINIEIIGSSEIAQDAYFVAMLDRLFADKLKLKTYGLLINFMGCPDDREQFKSILRTFLEANKTGICANCLQRKDRNIMRVFDCKNQCQALYRTGPQITDHLCKICKLEWESLQNLLQQLAVSFSHAPTLVRGLDYYSKTVFEFVSIDLGAQNTFCGGGRYNSLATALGGEQDQPSIGAAIGIERLLLMLEKLSDFPLPARPPLYAIMPTTPEQIPLALKVADLLYTHKFHAELLIEQDSLKSKMRQANKLGAATCILIGPDEQAAGNVTVKNMITGTEAKVLQRDLLEFLGQV